MELPDHLTALRNLLPFDFAVKEFQTFIVRAGRKRNVTDVTVGDGPLDGGVEVRAGKKRNVTEFQL